MLGGYISSLTGGYNATNMITQCITCQTSIKLNKFATLYTIGCYPDLYK